MRRRLYLIIEIIVFLCLIGMAVAFYLNQTVTSYILFDYTPSYKIGKFDSLPVSTFSVESSDKYENDSIAYESIRKSTADWIDYAREQVESEQELIQEARNNTGEAGVKLMQDNLHKCEVALHTKYSFVIVRHPRYMKVEDVGNAIRKSWPDTLYNFNSAKIEYYPLN